MKRLFRITYLLVSVLTILPWAIAVEITDIFTVQTGTDNGGCGNYMTELDNWLTEIDYSLHAAQEAIEDKYDQRVEVRRSMSHIFGVRNTGRLPQKGVRRKNVNDVNAWISHARDFIGVARGENGLPVYPRTNFRLFCDSAIFTPRAPTDTAVDFEGNPIVNKKNEPVAIKDVPIYETKLHGDTRNQAWWMGDHTDLNMYVFLPNPSQYCREEDAIGLTVDLFPLKRGPDGTAQNDDPKVAIILCPRALQDTSKPASYRDGSSRIEVGTDLGTVITRSATLLHEIFHAIGGAIFLGEGREKSDAINMANANPEDARRNPESYAFFVAHMYYLYGTNEGNLPESIVRNWDFHLIEREGGKTYFGALETEQMAGGPHARVAR
ncbi:hypothetical protein NLG97_g5559 [Lecanicillium saksenae]|uniref:Uncharacterized protein n=1 Tax=Lecanicillium saksenae TaxID=468837 RepID=A0ACC1QVB0_9HYPO|nr:hypothetical protein NLG97_g5559 [Lecanicillium saksenae]